MSALQARSRRTRVALALCAAPLALALCARVANALRLARLRPDGPIDLASLERASAMLSAAAGLELLARLAAMVALALWTGALYESALAAGLSDVRYTARAARWSWFVPVVHLARPALALASLRRALAEHSLPEPEPRPRADGTDGYRDNAAAPVPPPVHAPPAPLAAFWTAWIASMVPGRVADALLLAGAQPATPARLAAATALDALAALAALVALALGSRVVRGLDGAVREHARRAASRRQGDCVQ